MQSLGLQTDAGETFPLTTLPRPTIILRSPDTLRRLFLDDAHNGETVAYFGDASSVVPYLPKSRIKDTMLFELSDTRPLGYSILSDTDGAEAVPASLDAAWPSDVKTTQIDRFLIPACFALIETGGTLFQLPYLYSSETFRASVIAKTKDPAIRYELEDFDRRKKEKQDDLVNSLQNRFTLMKADRLLRAIISQPKTFENPGILIVDLPATERYDFLAALVLWKTKGVAYIERPLLHVGQSVPVIACDYLAQLPKDLRERLINTATILATRLGINDAETLKDQFAVDPGNVKLTELRDGDALVRMEKTHQVTVYAHQYPQRPSNLRRIRSNTQTRYGAPMEHIDDKIERFIKGL